MGYSDESNDELYEYDLPVSDSASESPSMTSIGSTSNHIASMLALKLESIYEYDLPVSDDAFSVTSMTTNVAPTRYPI